MEYDDIFHFRQAIHSEKWSFVLTEFSAETTLQTWNFKTRQIWEIFFAVNYSAAQFNYIIQLIQSTILPSARDTIEPHIFCEYSTLYINTQIAAFLSAKQVHSLWISK